MGIHAEFKSGTKLSAEPARWISERACFIWLMPPTARTAATARMVTMVILSTNWNKSVTRTPHSPDSAEMNEVSAIIPNTINSACVLVTPNVRVRIFTIARFTQPRMMQLMGIPR